VKIRSTQLNIILWFTLLIVVTILTIGVLSFYFFSDTLERNSLDNTNQVVMQLNRVIDNYISYMDNISMVVINNNDVQNYSREVVSGQALQGSSVVPVTPVVLQENVNSLFQSIISVRKDIDSIMLLLDNRTIVTDQPGDKINPYAQWLATVTPGLSGGSLTASLSSSHVQNIIAGKYPWVITLSRSVKDVKNDQHRGVLLVDLNYSVIADLCSDIQLGKSGYVFIINPAGEIVYHPWQQLIYSGLRSEPISQLKNLRNGHLTANVDGREVLYTTNTSAYTGWTVVGVSYPSELFYNRAELEYYIAMIAIFCFFVLVIISYLISVRITQPIEVLRRSVRAVEGGNFDIEIAVNSTDEVNGLAQDFNIAIRKIKDLIAQNVQAHEQKRRHELRALQAQINPHFLYNTLDSIIWMIECGEGEDAIVMTSTLARFFRLGISKGGDIITVKNEIDHLNYYLTIQKMRYKDKLDFLVDVNPEILSYRTPKLLIQPLVENAIYHGLKAQEQKGMLKVVGYKEGGALIFKVIDNGKGMTSQELLDLNNSIQPSKEQGGLGVANVRERIQLYFGGSYGVTFESVQGEGTVATIRLPALTEDDL
jgi:two-component system sensor histidine kinase YesM